jgi:hypothetical protein
MFPGTRRPKRLIPPSAEEEVKGKNEGKKRERERELL